MTQPIRDEKPPRATKEEMAREMPEPPLFPVRGSGGGMRGINLGGDVVKSVVFSVIAMVVIMFGALPYIGGGSFVLKKDFTTNIGAISTDISTMKADLTAKKAEIDKTVASIPADISAQVNQQVAQKMNETTNQYNTLSTKVNTWDSQIQTATSQAQASTNKNTEQDNSLSTLGTKVATNDATDKSQSDLITALQTKITEYETRIKALETPTPTTSGGGVIPATSFVISVIDEGILQSSNNSTLGQIKLKVANSGVKDLVNVIVDVYVTIDNADFATKDTWLLTGTYGSWSIREFSGDQMRIRGNINRVVAGQTPKSIFLDLTTFGRIAGQGRQTTYISVAQYDIVIIDWDYSS